METLDKATQTQIANIEKSTGKTMEQWFAIVKSSGLARHGEMVKFLKEQHGFTHGNANVVVLLTNRTHAGASDANELVDAQYKGREELRAWYENLLEKIKKFGSDVEIAPKKGYVSLRRKKQFALIQPSTKTRLDIGLNVKGVEATGKMEAAGSWNAMCTHRVRIEKESDIDKEVIELMKKAYEQAG